MRDREGESETWCHFNQPFTHAFYAAFLLLQFGFEFFRQKNIGAKAARKMLMKLTLGAT